MDEKKQELRPLTMGRIIRRSLIGVLILVIITYQFRPRETHTYDFATGYIENLQRVTYDSRWWDYFTVNQVQPCGNIVYDYFQVRFVTNDGRELLSETIRHPGVYQLRNGVHGQIRYRVNDPERIRWLGRTTLSN